LFYVFALVSDGEKNQYFVMNQRTANRLIDENRAKAPPNYTKHRSGILWSREEKHENVWRVLPDYKPLPKPK
jgi:hypothetical protein